MTNIEGATAGHIHLGKKGENGPVVVTLFKYDSPMNEVPEKERWNATEDAQRNQLIQILEELINELKKQRGND